MLTDCYFSLLAHRKQKIRRPPKVVDTEKMRRFTIIRANALTNLHQTLLEFIISNSPILRSGSNLVPAAKRPCAAVLIAEHGERAGAKAPVPSDVVGLESRSSGSPLATKS